MNTHKKETKYSRRAFFGQAGKIGAIGSAIGLGFSNKLFAHSPKPELLEKYGRKAGEWIPSCCSMCGSQSGIMVHVIDGKVRKIEPNPHNPNNISCSPDDFFKNGNKSGVASICAKGNAGIMALYDADRIQKPLKRTNPDKGWDQDPGWVEISWDEALDEIAGELKSLRDQNNAHKLAWISEDHSFTHIQADFCELFGTPNYYMHSSMCDVGRKAGGKWIVGDERPLNDFYKSKYIMLWGWNPLEAIKWIYLPRMINEAIHENGAKLVVVDPVASITAMKAHRHLQIKPGTDGALALAIGHVIIKNDLHDKDFIAKWGEGFEQYADYVKDKTPEWAENITGIKASVIEEVALELATNKPATIDMWSGSHYTNGVNSVRAVFILNGLLGTYDSPGGLCSPVKKGNSHDHIHAHKIEQPLFVPKELYPFYHKSGNYGRMFLDIANGTGSYDIDTMMIVFQNPAMAVPNGMQLFPDAAKKMRKIFVVDTMMSETAHFADIVLPGSVYLERYDLNTHWVLWPALGLRQPVVKPIFGQPTEYETITELGRRIGIKDADGKDFFSTGKVSGEVIDDKTKWYEEYLSKELLIGEPKISLEELKKLPGAVWVGPKDTPIYFKYEKELDLKNPAILSNPKFKVEVKDGNVYEVNPDEKDPKKGKKLIGVMVNGIAYKGFNTKTRKFEFASPWAADVKDAFGNPLDVVPAFREIDPKPTEEYPLLCINWKEATHTHARSQNNRWLLEVKPNNPIYIHPTDAEKYGVKSGDTLKVTSAYGQSEGKAFITKRINTGTIGSLHGFGHTHLGSAAKKAGGFAGSSALNKPGFHCGISGQQLNKHVLVRIEKV